MMTSELERTREENQKLKRRIAKMQKDLELLKKDPFFYPFWAQKDLEKSYGPTNN